MPITPNNKKTLAINYKTHIQQETQLNAINNNLTYYTIKFIIRT